MTEEKNSLLGYLLCDQEQQNNIFCREMDDSRKVQEYTYKDTIVSSGNFGKLLREENSPSKCIPMFLETSFDFLRVFFGILSDNRVCVPIHTIANEEAISHILQKIKADSLVVTKPSLYRKLITIDYVQEHIHTIFCSPEIIAEKALPSKHIDITQVFERELSVEDARSIIEQAHVNTDTDDPMQIVFTSGTTGEPKGAVLSHRNLISCIVRAGNFLNIDSSYRTLTFLPLSHVMAQNEVFIAFVKGAVIQIVGRDNLLHGLHVFRPNILVAVPRVYQAIYQGIYRKLRNKDRARKLLDLSVKMHTELKEGKSLWSKIKGGVFSYTIGRMITSKVKKNIGDFKILVTAGAACPEHIYEFFAAIGLPLTNAQGLTEASGAIVYNEPGKTVKGSIGTPLKGVEVKIAKDGEILLKGDPIFRGYFEDPQQNKASFSNGWFRTGDLGEKKKIKGKDYVFLLGRKKEILVLSSGLNVPAVQIEEKLLRHELIQQAMVVGDGKPRLGALIVPRDDNFNNPNIREEISKVIREVNHQMDASERISQFEIVPEPFTVENGMLTPTMKIRRPAVSQHYQHLIIQLYEAPAG
jgi:long-chain acyl-CoA synthetase